MRYISLFLFLLQNIIKIEHTQKTFGIGKLILIFTWHLCTSEIEHKISNELNYIEKKKNLFTFISNVLNDEYLCTVSVLTFI